MSASIVEALEAAEAAGLADWLRPHIAEELAAALGPHRVAMLKSHGAVIAGADVIETFVLAIYLEETAKRQYMARALGTPYALGAAEVEKISANLRKPHLLKKVWDFHHAKLRPDGRNPRAGGDPI